MVTSASVSILRVQAQTMFGQLVADLLKEGYEQGMAYRIAITQAEEWAVSKRTTAALTSVSNYHVIPHPNGWAVRQPMSKASCFFFKTHDEAVQFGQELAQSSNSTLVIHDSRGDFESRKVYLKAFAKVN